MGADGANSQIRRLGGFGSWGWGYGQEAVVCTVKVATRDAAQQAEGQYSTVQYWVEHSVIYLLRFA